MKKIKILFLLSLIGYSSFSQTDSVKKLIYCSSEFYLLPKTASGFNQQMAKQISKETNSNLEKNLSNYEHYYGNFTGMSAGAAINFGFNFNKKKPNQITRLSLGVYSQTLATAYYYNDTITFLKYVPSNSTLYNSFSIVEINSKRINYSYNIVCLNATGAYLFYTERQRYVSAYAGLSVSFASTVSAKVNSTYYESKQAGSQDPLTGQTSFLSPNVTNTDFSQFESYSTKAKAAAIMSAGFPLGIELRCSKNRKRLKHLAFAFELMPQLNYVVSPNLIDKLYLSFKTTPFNAVYRF